MLEINQLVSLTMNEERGTLDLRHDVYVPESVVNQILKHVPCLFSDNVSD